MDRIDKLYFIQDMTESRKSWLDDALLRARNFKEDPDKTHRIKAQECQYCYYADRIGGASIRGTNCLFCDKHLISGSTAVDSLCKECAGEEGLCKHCGADINLKNRRKLKGTFKDA